MKAGFKTGANSASTNVNQLGECAMLIKDPIEVTMRIEDKRDDQQISKGNLKKQGNITRS